MFFSYTKDKTPLMKNFRVVYFILCSDWSDTYVGEICQRLETRLKQYKSDVNKHNGHTALAVHAFTIQGMYLISIRLALKVDKNLN